MKRKMESFYDTFLGSFEKQKEKHEKFPYLYGLSLNLCLCVKVLGYNFFFYFNLYLNDQASPLGKFIFLKFCSHNSHIIFASFQVEEKRSEKFSSLLNILYTYTPQIICWGMSGKKKFAKRFHVAVGEFFSDKINIK